MMEKKCTMFCKGAWIGGAIALGVLLSKKEYRERVAKEAKQVKQCTVDAVNFVRDNREQIIAHIRETANEVSTMMRDISEDVKQLSQAASHLKESSEEIVKATKEAAAEIKTLKK